LPYQPQAHLSVEQQALLLRETARHLSRCAALSYRLASRKTVHRDGLSGVLTHLSEAYARLVENAVGPVDVAGASPEAEADRRANYAYAHAALLVNKALLRAAPSLECAVRAQLSPETEAPFDLREYRSSLLSVHEQLTEAARAVAEFSEGLTGPEPELLRQIKAGRPGVFSRVTSGVSSGRSKRAARSATADRPAATQQPSAPLLAAGGGVLAHEPDNATARPAVRGLEVGGGPDHRPPRAMLALQPRKRFAKDTVLIVDGTWYPPATTPSPSSRRTTGSPQPSDLTDADTCLVVAVGRSLAGNHNGCKSLGKSPGPKPP
jgi:hypothetical protein